MMDVMYEIPSDDSIACCTITKDTVEKEHLRSLNTEQM